MSYRPGKYRISIGVYNFDVEHAEPKAGEQTKYQTRISVSWGNDMITMEVAMKGTSTPCQVMERVCELHEFLTTKWT